jgi:glycosyltransferase involved in cell wall biosynthesis
MTPYLIVASAFTPTGGMERANHALALHLAQLGGPLHLVGHHASPGILAFENVRFHRAPRPLNADLLGMPLVNWIGRHWARRISAAGGRVIVNGGNCPWGDVNWVHYVHAAWGSGWKRRWFMWDERRAIRRANLIISNSARTTADLVDKLGTDKNRIATVYLGVDADRFCPPTDRRRADLRRQLGWRPDEKVILFVGAASDRRKGLDRLIAAWQNVGGEEKWRLVTVGANGPRDVRNAQWLGFRPDIENILCACDLVAAPSRYESYGLGVHEALCMGTPAMVAASAGVAEQYPPALRPLLLKDVEDSRQIAACLKHWAARQNDYRAAALALSALLRRRDWNAMAAELIDVIEKRDAADQPIMSADGSRKMAGGFHKSALPRTLTAEPGLQPTEADVL